MGHKLPQLPPCKRCYYLPPAGYDPPLCACYNYDERYGSATTPQEIEDVRDCHLEAATANVLMGVMFVAGTVVGFALNDVLQWIGVLP